jgi:SAM-dependent methyltransferase
MVIEKIFISIKKNGLPQTTKKLFLKIPNIPLIFLRMFFGYNSWHDSLYFQRNYAQKIVSHLNSRSVKRSVLEIGCGTGDILRRCDFKKKVGLDSESEVLSALHFLCYLRNRGGEVKTFKFDFASDNVNGKYDSIILCNWIHEINPSLLKIKIKEIFDSHLCDGGEIVLDVLDNPTYKYNHKMDDLTQGLSCSMTMLGQFEFGRNVFSILKPIKSE